MSEEGSGSAFKMGPVAVGPLSLWGQSLCSHVVEGMEGRKGLDKGTASAFVTWPLPIGPTS
jgi:hypothetical protein